MCTRTWTASIEFCRLAICTRSFAAWFLPHLLWNFFRLDSVLLRSVCTIMYMLARSTYSSFPACESFHVTCMQYATAAETLECMLYENTCHVELNSSEIHVLSVRKKNKIIIIIIIIIQCVPVTFVYSYNEEKTGKCLGSFCQCYTHYSNASNVVWGFSWWQQRAPSCMRAYLPAVVLYS